MVGAHVYDPPMVLEGLPPCNEASQARCEGSSVHTASAVPVHSHGWEGEEDGVPQGEEGGTLAASHKQNKSL